MFRYSLLIFIIFPLLLCGMEFSFPTGSDRWEGDFTDYPVNKESFYELSWGWEDLPTSVISPTGKLLEKGLFLSGNNHSDDLFMFARRKIDKVKPNSWYRLNFSVLIESNEPTNAIGIGGAPGESIFFKVGASTEEPQKIAIGGYYYLNVDKGDQSQAGENAQVIGHLANAEVNPNEPVYLPKILSTYESLCVKSDQNGEFWIFLGTDSGFEGPTKFYIAQITMDLYNN